MRIVVKPDALTRSIRAPVTTGLPHAVSLGTPLVLASSWLPRFQPLPRSATIVAASPVIVPVVGEGVGVGVGVAGSGRAWASASASWSA